MGRGWWRGEERSRGAGSPGFLTLCDVKSLYLSDSVFSSGKWGETIACLTDSQTPAGEKLDQSVIVSWEPPTAAQI